MDGLKSSENTFRLVRNGTIPEILHVFMLTTACMRVLRAVYGSDLETAAAIRKLVIDKEEHALLPTCPVCHVPADELGCLCGIEELR